MRGRAKQRKMAKRPCPPGYIQWRRPGWVSDEMIAILRMKIDRSRFWYDFARAAWIPRTEPPSPAEIMADGRRIIAASVTIESRS